MASLSAAGPPDAPFLAASQDLGVFLGGSLLRQLRESSFGHTSIWSTRSTQLSDPRKGRSARNAAPPLLCWAPLPLASPLMRTRH